MMTALADVFAALPEGDEEDDDAEPVTRMQAWEAAAASSRRLKQMEAEWSTRGKKRRGEI
jgi:hypothetical protein